MLLVKPALTAPATSVELERPKLAAKAAEPAKPKPKPAPKPQPKPAPKPAPKPQPKPEPAAKPAAEQKVAKTVQPQVPPQEQEQKKLLTAYRSNVLKLTYLNTQYPKRAMDFQQEGLVVLKIKVNRKGKLLDVVEETSSKHKLLNKAAQKAVKKTAPYPEVPKNLLGDSIEISLPFNFKL